MIAYRKYTTIITILFFVFSNSDSKELECQGAKLRVINKITTELVYYDIPLYQTLDLDNAKIKIFKCVKLEEDSRDDEIALLSHKLNTDTRQKAFLGWVFRSSQYLNSPLNPFYDIKLEKCLLKDPIFLKKSYSK